MSGPLKALIVGCGRIAGGFDEYGPDSAVLSHAGAYQRHSGFEIVACVEPDTECRDGFAKTWAVPAAFSNLDKCLEADTPFDVASVCVPTANHGAILERLLDTEVKAVFCEKPLTDDVAGSERLIKAYAEAGVLLAVNYLRRWDPSVVALRHEIESGEWGQVRTAMGYYTKGVLNNGSEHSSVEAAGLHQVGPDRSRYDGQARQRLRQHGRAVGAAAPDLIRGTERACGAVGFG